MEEKFVYLRQQLLQLRRQRLAATLAVKQDEFEVILVSGGEKKVNAIKVVCSITIT